MVTIFSYACNKETCNDGELNQDETSIDCGGTECDPCPTCGDGVQNQGETGIDCGGPCQECGVDPTCSDGIQNQGETGVDCGGECSPCGAADCNNLQNGLSYTRDGGTNVTPDVISALISSGNLVISATDIASNTVFQITQTSANFGTGTFDVGVTTPVQFTDNNASTVYSTINSESSGTITFSDFVQSSDCNYVSGSYNLNLSESTPNPSSSAVVLEGTFTEIAF